MQITYKEDVLKDLFYSYQDKYAELESAISPKAIRKEYGTGGIIHRGYYCPSKTVDIVIGGAKRGRVSRKPSCEEHCKSVFYFNSANRLIQVDEYGFFPERTLCTREFLWGHDDIELACIYNMNLASLPKICQASICEYDPDGRILLYQTLLSGAFLEDDPLRSFWIQAEEYNYDPESDLLETVLRGKRLVHSEAVLGSILQKYRFSSVQELIESSSLYRFQHDEEGRVVSYTAQEMSPNAEDKPHFTALIPKSKQRMI